MKNVCLCAWGLCLIGLFLVSAEGALYTGMNNGASSDILIGDTATLQFTDDSTTVSGVLKTSAGFLAQDRIVFYLDSIPEQGFVNTASFSDNADRTRAAVSGMNVTSESRNTAIFAQGFAADYAIVLAQTGGTLFRLVSGDDNSLEDIGSVNMSSTGQQNTFNFSFQWAQIGAPDGTGFKFQSAHLSPLRYPDSFEAVTGSFGWGGTVNYQDFNVYGQPVPEPIHVALAAFGGLFLTVTVVRKRWTKRP